TNPFPLSLENVSPVPLKSSDSISPFNNTFKLFEQGTKPTVSKTPLPLTQNTELNGARLDLGRENNDWNKSSVQESTSFPSSASTSVPHQFPALPSSSTSFKMEQSNFGLNTMQKNTLPNEQEKRATTVASLLQSTSLPENTKITTNNSSNLLQMVNQFHSQLKLLDKSFNESKTTDQYSTVVDKSLDLITKSLTETTQSLQAANRTLKTLANDHLESLATIENARRQIKLVQKESLYHLLRDRQLDPWTQNRLDTIKMKYDKIKHDLAVIVQLTHTQIHDKSVMNNENEENDNEDFLPELELSYSTQTLKHHIQNRIRVLSKKVTAAEKDIETICSNLKSCKISSNIDNDDERDIEKKKFKNSRLTTSSIEDNDSHLLSLLQSTRANLVQIKVPAAAVITLSDIDEKHQTPQKKTDESSSISKNILLSQLTQQLGVLPSTLALSPTESESFTNMLRLVRTSIDIVSGSASPEALEVISNTLSASPIQRDKHKTQENRINTNTIHKTTPATTINQQKAAFQPPPLKTNMPLLREQQSISLGTQNASPSKPQQSFTSSSEINTVISQQPPPISSPIKSLIGDPVKTPTRVSQADNILKQQPPPIIVTSTVLPTILNPSLITTNASSASISTEADLRSSINKTLTQPTVQQDASIRALLNESMPTQSSTALSKTIPQSVPASVATTSSSSLAFGSGFTNAITSTPPLSTPNGFGFGTTVSNIPASSAITSLVTSAAPTTSLSFPLSAGFSTVTPSSAASTTNVVSSTSSTVAPQPSISVFSTGNVTQTTPSTQTTNAQITGFPSPSSVITTTPTFPSSTPSSTSITTPFGATQNSTGFGSQPSLPFNSFPQLNPVTSPPFGGFGQSAQLGSSVFAVSSPPTGTTPTTIFGSASTGNPAMSGGFGSLAANTSPASTGGFGSSGFSSPPSTGFGSFGSPTSQTQATGGTFGAFGANSSQQPSGGFGSTFTGFGQPASNNGGSTFNFAGFGQNTSTPSQGIFGQSSSVFGSSSLPPAQPQGPAFGGSQSFGAPTQPTGNSFTSYRK
ncbi:unnamed protein product, partial [Didymodactylos carnosus]